MDHNLPNTLKGKRFVYLKHGNVVEEAKQLFLGSDTTKKGAFTYVGQFFKIFNEEKCLLISFSNKETSFSYQNWHTCTINKKWGETKPLGHLVNSLRQAVLTFSYLKQFRPDFILSSPYRAPLLACYIYHKIYGAQLIHTRHNIVNPSKNIFNQLAAKVDNMVIRRLQAVLCHGNYLKQQLLDIGVKAERISLFRAGYRSFLEASKRKCSQYENLTEDNTKQVICFSGRVVTAKGIFDLLEACRDRLESNPNLLLYYLGTGVDLDKLKDKISSLNLSNQVLCPGWIDHDQLASIIKQSYFVVTPSRSIFPEGFPKAAVEPLILGKPVIVPDYGPFSPFITNEANGLIFKSDSVKSLKQSVNRLLDDEVLYKKLKKGAEESGKELIDPPMTFAEALLNALKQSEAS